MNDGCSHFWQIYIRKATGDSVSCQLVDIGSHSQLSNEQSGAYPSKHVHDWCISKQTCSFVQNLSQQKHLPLEKSYAHRQVFYLIKSCVISETG